MGDSCPRIVRAVLLALPVLVLAACTSAAQTAKPAASAGTASAASTASAAATSTAASSGPLAKTYSMTFDNLTFSETSDGSLTSMVVDGTGGVTGYMTVDGPELGGTGPLSGTLKDGTLTFTDGSGDYTGTVDASTGKITGTYTYPGQQGTWTAAPGSAVAVDCTRQDPSACLNAANDVAGLDAGDITAAPSGMTMQTHVVDADGFAGAAFTDGQGSIIIADEAADLASPFGTATTFQNTSFLADVQIYKGVRPAALSSAVQFAQQVAAANGSASIYVAGFGLGGVEAEAQAQALGSQLAGGATFGAPGLPGYQAVSGQGATVYDFIDYGDPVGNWASDPDSELTELAGKNIDHYGDVQVVGNPLTAALPRLAANTHSLMLSSGMEKLLPEGVPDTKLIDSKLNINAAVEGAEDAEKVGNLYDDSLQLAVYAYLGGAELLYHSVTQYATDLNVSLAGTVAPAISMAEYEREFDPNATTAALQAANSTTVSSAGTISAPTYTLTGITSSDEPGAQTFTDQSGSQYDVTYDPDAQVSTLAVNDPDGTSYVIANDDSGQQLWSAKVSYYSGPDQGGTLTGTLYDWRAGGSQLQLFTGLPPGVSKQTLSYSQPDGTGTLVSTTSN